MCFWSCQSDILQHLVDKLLSIKLTTVLLVLKYLRILIVWSYGGWKSCFSFPNESEFLTLIFKIKHGKWNIKQKIVLSYISHNSLSIQEIFMHITSWNEPPLALFKILICRHNLKKFPSVLSKPYFSKSNNLQNNTYPKYNSGFQL